MLISPAVSLSPALTRSARPVARVLRDSDGLEALREQVADGTDAAAAAAVVAAPEPPELAATPAADTVGGATGPPPPAGAGERG